MVALKRRFIYKLDSVKQKYILEKRGDIYKTYRKKITIFVFLLISSCIFAISALSQLRLGRVAVPYPTLEVTNGVSGGVWREYNVLGDGGEYVFRYRLNFGFPQQTIEEHNLRSFSVIQRT